jgi:hypothetical protein
MPKLKRMQVQCARIAFGLSGIYDADEAQRIKSNSGNPNCNKIRNQTKTKGTEAILQELSKQSS